MAVARSEAFREQACPLAVCDGSGWILGPEDVARPCECREQRLKKGRSKGVASVIPPRFRGVGFDRPPVSDMARDLETKGAVAEVQAFVDGLDEKMDDGQGSLALRRYRYREDDPGDVDLEGGAGGGPLGRDLLAAEAARPHPAHLRVRAGRATPISQFFDRLTSVDLLHIDDLGAEKRSDWVLEQLYALINERYETQRSMLITTNLPHQELEEQIGARTVSRLSQICDQVALFGDDHRYGKAEAA